MVISDSAQESLLTYFEKKKPNEFPHKVAVLAESATWDQSAIIQKHIWLWNWDTIQLHSQHKQSTNSVEAYRL